MMNPKILVTLGPSSLNKECIQQMAGEFVHLFRINLSHTSADSIEEIISRIQAYTEVPICLDSEGAQIRTHKMKDGEAELVKSNVIKIHFTEVTGDSQNLSFSQNHVASQFRVDDILTIDFNSARIKIIEVNSDHCLARVEEGGLVGSNKAANLINRNIELEAITIKDKQAIKIGLDMNVKHFALSFANSGKDVQTMRQYVGEQSTIISKVESMSGLNNLHEILDNTNEILIDRGDLSREVPLEKIPFLQRRIISLARSKSKPVNVATNLLESMVTTQNPTRAEINDVVSTLIMGANGLVLAAETAIGSHPVGAVKMIRRLIEQYYKWTTNSSIDEILQS